MSEPFDSGAPNDRRQKERRNPQSKLEGEDRRKGIRRSGMDRRKEPRN